MRLIHYLNENIFGVELKDIKKKIHKECQPFLRAAKGHTVWRGMDRKPEYGKFKVRKNRKPVDTPADVHKEFDKIFTKNFGWPARSSGLLATGDEIVAGSYGTLYQIFPIGKFKFIWSDNVHDLYGRYIEFMTNQGLIYAGGGDWKLVGRILKEPVKSEDLYLSDKELNKYQAKVFTELDDFIKKNYSDKNLVQAIKSNNEIMIDCKEYYALLKN